VDTGLGVIYIIKKKKEKIDTEYQSKSSFEGADASGIEASPLSVKLPFGGPM